MSRPADILVQHWNHGRPVALDISVVSPLNPSTLAEAGEMVGAVLEATESRKHQANDEKCLALGKLTGEELPERYIWRMCMSLVAMPLILDGVVLHRALSFEAGVLQRWWLRMLNTTVLLLHFMQMYLLLSVTYLSSKEHMDYHVDMWYTFFGTSLLHMFSLFLLLYLGKQRPFSNRDRKAMKFRLVCLAIHLTGVGAFIHFANRHWDCEPYGILLPILV
eukprot:Em0021g419a